MTRLFDNLIRKHLRALHQALPDAVRAETEPIHHARVASRRLRELMPIVALITRSDAALRAGRDLRKLTRLLGEVRELDVSLTVLAELSKDRVDRRRAAEVVRSLLEVRRTTAVAAMRRRVRPLQAVRRVKKLDVMVDELAETGPARKPKAAVARQVGKRAVELCAAMRAAGVMYVAEPIHEVRIAIKKLRYGLEIGRDVRALSAVQAGISTLKRAQEELGRVHDLEIVLVDIRRAEAAQPPDSIVRRDLERLGMEAEKEIRRHHGVFVSSRESLIAIAERYRIGRTEWPVLRPKPVRASLRKTRRLAAAS